MSTKTVRIAVWVQVVCCFLGCSKNDQALLDKESLDSLFNYFSPVYNYTTEPTTLLAHSSQVTAAGLDTWYAFKGVKQSTGAEVISRNTMFRVGSSTKMFTATMILQLWEEGLIDLDAPFNNYLKLDEAIYPKISLFGNVTIKNLLNHRSGIPRISSTTFFDTHDYTDSISQNERMKFLFTECDPEFSPGTTYAYRNSNFNILGFIIEKVTQKSYVENLRERIAVPLGLEHTHMLDYDVFSNDPEMAHGYTSGFDGTDYHGSQAYAAGDLVSTAADLTIFMEALSQGKLFKNAATFNLMVTPDEGYHYGMGMFITETPMGTSYGHSGAIFGYNTRLEYFPEDNVIIISTMSFDGYDFMVTNWYDDYCYRIIDEIRRARQP